MPGLGMGLMLVQGQEQRLEQRLTLEQRLEQKLILTQRLELFQTLDTKGDKKLYEEEKILGKIIKDLENNIYPDYQNFHYRVMKRIKKKDRSEEIKKMITSIRGIIDHLEPELKNLSPEKGLDKIKELIQLGTKSIDQKCVASELYSTMNLVYGNVSKTINPFKLIELGKKVEPSSIAAVVLYEFFGDFINKGYKNKKLDHVINKTESLIQKDSNNLNSHLENIGNFISKKTPYSNLEIGFDAAVEIYHLIKHLAYRDYTQGLPDILKKKNLKQMAEDYSNITLPVFLQVLKYNDKHLISRLNELCKNKYFRKKIDCQRAFFIGLNILNKRKDGKIILKDIFQKCNAKQASKVFSNINLLDLQKKFYYPFNQPDGESIIAAYKRREYTSNPLFKELDASHIDKIMKLSLINQVSHELFILIRLAEIYDSKKYGNVAFYKDGVALLGEMAKQHLDDNFKNWRYSHEKASRQLKMLDNEIDSWKENIKITRIIGDVKGAESKLGSINAVIEEFKEVYKEKYGCKVSEMHITGLEKIIDHTVGKITEKTFKGEKASELGKELGKIKNRYYLVKAIVETGKVTVENYLKLGEKLKSLARNSDAELKPYLEQIVEIVGQKELKNLTPITVTETDDLGETLEVGLIPVKTCQRWTEKTSYNECLPAYSVDSNKKLFQLRTQYRNILARSIVRLLKFEDKELDDEIPLLLIERPYSNNWTDDFSKLLLTAVGLKALKISEETGKRVAIGVSCNDARGTTKSLLKNLDYLAKTYDKKLGRKTLKYNLPKSMNKYEYSDALGMTLKSGQNINSTIKYLILECE